MSRDQWLTGLYQCHLMPKGSMQLNYNVLITTPPTKWQEGDVSICVCQSFCPMWPLPMMHWTSLYSPTSATRPGPAGHQTWAITGDLFKLVPLRTLPPGSDLWWWLWSVEAPWIPLFEYQCFIKGAIARSENNLNTTCSVWLNKILASFKYRFVFVSISGHHGFLCSNSIW